MVSLLVSDCKTTGDIHAKLKQLFASAVEQILETEMDEHLGYEKHNIVGNNSGNSRKATTQKLSKANTVKKKPRCPTTATAASSRR